MQPQHWQNGLWQLTIVLWSFLCWKKPQFLWYGGLVGAVSPRGTCFEIQSLFFLFLQAIYAIVMKVSSGAKIHGHCATIFAHWLWTSIHKYLNKGKETAEVVPEFIDSRGFGGQFLHFIFQKNNNLPLIFCRAEKMAIIYMKIYEREEGKRISPSFAGRIYDFVYKFDIWPRWPIGLTENIWQNKWPFCKM